MRGSVENADRDRGVLAGAVFAVLFAQVLLYPGVDTLVAALGAETGLDASMWFLAAEFAAFVAFAGVWGIASDVARVRVPLIVLGSLGAAAGYVVLAAVPSIGGVSFGAVVALRVLQGAATIGAFSLSITMLMDLGGGHGRNMGAAGIAIGLGTALGAPVGGQLYEQGPLVPLYAAGLLMALVAAAVWTIPDRVPEKQLGVGAVVGKLRSTPSLSVPYAFGFVDRLTAGTFALVGTLYFRTVFGLSPGATGAMLALFFGPFALLQYPFGALSDRIGRTIPVAGGSALYGLAVVGVGLAPSVSSVGLAMIVVGVVGAFMAPATMALVTDLAGESERALAMAGFNVAGSVGFLAGIVIGGLAADALGYPVAFALVGGLEIAVALVAIPAVVRVAPGPAPSDGDTEA